MFAAVLLLCECTVLTVPSHRPPLSRSFSSPAARRRRDMAQAAQELYAKQVARDAPALLAARVARHALHKREECVNSTCSPGLFCASDQCCNATLANPVDSVLMGTCTCGNLRVPCLENEVCNTAAEGAGPHKCCDPRLADFAFTYAQEDLCGCRNELSPYTPYSCNPGVHGASYCAGNGTGCYCDANLCNTGLFGGMCSRDFRECCSETFITEVVSEKGFSGVCGVNPVSGYCNYCDPRMANTCNNFTCACANPNNTVVSVCDFQAGQDRCYPGGCCCNHNSADSCLEGVGCRCGARSECGTGFNNTCLSEFGCCCPFEKADNCVGSANETCQCGVDPVCEEGMWCVKDDSNLGHCCNKTTSNVFTAGTCRCGESECVEPFKHCVQSSQSQYFQCIELNGDSIDYNSDPICLALPSGACPVGLTCTPSGCQCEPGYCASKEGTCTNSTTCTLCPIGTVRVNETTCSCNATLCGEVYANSGGGSCTVLNGNCCAGDFPQCGVAEGDLCKSCNAVTSDNCGCTCGTATEPCIEGNFCSSNGAISACCLVGQATGLGSEGFCMCGPSDSQCTFPQHCVLGSDPQVSPQCCGRDSDSLLYSGRGAAECICNATQNACSQGYLCTPSGCVCDSVTCTGSCTADNVTCCDAQSTSTCGVDPMFLFQCLTCNLTLTDRCDSSEGCICGPSGVEKKNVSNIINTASNATLLRQVKVRHKARSGVACAPPQFCSEAMCVCPSGPEELCGPSCLPCPANTHCNQATGECECGAECATVSGCCRDGLCLVQNTTSCGNLCLDCSVDRNTCNSFGACVCGSSQYSCEFPFRCFEDLCVENNVGVTCPSGTAVVGQAYYASNFISGGNGALSVSIVGLPGGLAFSPPRAISGTPEQTGSFVYTVMIEDSAAFFSFFSCSLDVYDPITANNLTLFMTWGVSFSYDLSASVSGGGGSPYAFSVLSGSLPSGVSLSEGTIFGTPTIEKRRFSEYNLTLRVQDGPSIVEGVLGVNVIVTDPLAIPCPTNDIIANTLYTTTLQASGGYPPYFYCCGSDDFTVDSSTGVASGSVATGPVLFVVAATDSAVPAVTAPSQTCTIDVVQPLFFSCSFGVAIAGTPVDLSLVATGGRVPYSFNISTGGLPLNVNLEGSQITGTPTQQGSYNFAITAVDQTAPVQAFTSNCVLQVVNQLVVSCPMIPAFIARQNSSLTVVPFGGLPPFTYAIDANVPNMTFSNGQLVAEVWVPGMYQYNVTAFDSAGQNQTINCTLFVVPALEYICPVLEVEVNQTVAVWLGANVIGGVGPYVFGASSSVAGLTLSPSGVLAGAATEVGVNVAVFTIADKSQQTVNASCNVTVLDTLKIVCPNVAALVNVPYAATLVATGGANVRIFDVQGGPDGLMVLPSGNLYGTLSWIGSAWYTASVRDYSGEQLPPPQGRQNASAQCQLVVVEVLTCSSGGNAGGSTGPSGSTGASGSTGPSGSTGSTGPNNNNNNNCGLVVDLVQYEAFNKTVGVAGGLGPFSFSVNGGVLPDGIVLDPLTGEFSGASVVAGVFEFTVMVSDSTPGNAQMVSVSSRFTVVSQVEFTCMALTVVEGIPFSTVFPSSGGVGPYSFRLSSGGLPGGVTLNGTTGEVAGMAAEGSSGSYTYEVEVRDSGAALQVVKKTCMIVVVPRLVFSCGSYVARVNVSFSTVLVASGGQGTITFTASTALPEGLSLGLEGGLSGVATGEAGVYVFGVNVSDTSGQSVVETCNVTVVAPLVFGCPVPAATGIVGVAYVAVVPVSGGLAPLTVAFGKSGGPAGFTMDANGTFYGVAGETGTFGYEVDVSDSSGQVGVQQCSLTVVEALSFACPTVQIVLSVPVSEQLALNSAPALPVVFSCGRTAGELVGVGGRSAVGNAGSGGILSV